MSNTMKAFRMSLLAGAAALLAASGAHAQLDRALQVARESTVAGASTQTTINQLADAADNDERAYLALREQIESQEIFLEQQRVFLESQAIELTELESQLERVGNIERDLTPMLLEMFVALEDFVAQDLPFRLTERVERLDRIRGDLENAQILPAERYRVLLNAYEIEAAYGRSLEAYSEQVEIDGVPYSGEFLQIGRVALIRDVAGNLEIMTKDNQSWRPVPASMANDVNRAFRIAKEVTTPEVFIAPLPGPQAQ